MKIYVCLFSFLVCTNIAKSTCIIIFRTRNAIYVAADSKSAGIARDGKKIFPFVRSINKIHNFGQTYYAISGHDDAALFHTADELLKKNELPNIFINDYARTITTYYTSTMKSEKKWNKNYDYYLKTGLAKVCFFHFDGDMPICASIEFHLNEDKNGVPHINYSIDNWYNQYIDVLGYSDHIEKELPNLKLDPNHPELYIEQMVKIEMKHHSQYIGNPIVLLKLTKDGAIWIRKNTHAVSI